MKLSNLIQHLQHLEEVKFKLPNNSYVPSHFHVTEVGKVTRDFVDCGGTRRQEEVINFQLYSATDYDHRLAPKKLIDIIQLSQDVLGLKDSEIEVEYQASTIGKYKLEFDGKQFLLQNMHTDCLAKDQCGIPSTKPKLNLSELKVAQNTCSPGSGCC